MIEAVLVVMLTYCTGGGCTSIKEYKMPSMEACFEAVKNSKIDVSDGGDTEGSALLYCVPKGSKL